MGNQCFDLVISEFVLERLHLVAIISDTFLDDFCRVGIGEGRLDFGFGQILDAPPASYHGASLAILSVTLGAIHFPQLSAIIGNDGTTNHAREEGSRDGCFYKYLCFHFHNCVSEKIAGFSLAPKDYLERILPGRIFKSIVRFHHVV